MQTVGIPHRVPGLYISTQQQLEKSTLNRYIKSIIRAKY
jgi:hypothetical protein